MRKMARKFSALLLVMSIVTLVWLVWLVYALSEPHPVLYAYNAVLYEGTPDEWYKPEQLDVMLTPIDSTHLYCCAPSPSLYGYIIKYNGKFYRLEELPHVDYGPFGPNDFLNNNFLENVVLSTVMLAFGWVATSLIIFKVERKKH